MSGTELGALNILSWLILATTLQGSYSIIIFVLHMRNAWLRKVKSLAQGHMAWKRQSQNSKPCLFDYKLYALMPCCFPGNLAGECLYASAGPPFWPLYSLDLPEPRPGGCELWPPCQARQDCWGKPGRGRGHREGSAGLKLQCCNQWLFCMVGQGHSHQGLRNRIRSWENWVA